MQLDQLPQLPQEHELVHVRVRDFVPHMPQSVVSLSVSPSWHMPLGT
jgi:hypothetical protein